MRLRGLERVLILLYAVSLPLSVTLSWGMLIAGIAASAALFFFGRAGETARVRWARPPLTLPLAAFVLAVAVSGFCAGGVSEAVQSVLTLRPLIVYFWAYQVFQRDEGAVSSAVQLLLSVGAVAGLWGTVQQVTGFHPFGYQWLQGTGFHGGPMAFAGQMQIFSALAVGILLGKGYAGFAGKLGSRPVFVLVTVGNLLGVFFAGERSAWLGAVAGVMTVASVVSWRVAIKASMAILAIAILSWTFVPVVKQRLEPLTAWQTDVSARVRLFLWRESFTIFQRSPVVGVGIRRFPRFDIPEAIVPGRSKDINHAHSNYVHILTTTGVVGAAAYLYLWFSAVMLAVRNLRLNPPGFRRALALGVLGGIVALSVSGIFEYNFGTSQVRLAEWFVLAMLLAGAVPAVKPAS